MKIKILKLIETIPGKFAIKGFSDSQGEIFFKPFGSSCENFYQKHKGDVVEMDESDFDIIQQREVSPRRKVHGSLSNILGMRHFDNPLRRI